MTPRHDAAQPVDHAAPPLPEHLLALFDHTGSHKTIDTLVVELLDGFAQAPGVSSTVPPEVLAEAFSTNRVPVSPHSPVEYLRELARDVVAHCVRTASPHCLGHMAGPALSVMPQLARVMTALNQNMVKVEASKAFTPYERQTIARLHHQVYGLSEPFYRRHAQRNDSTLGMLTSGGTVANLSALWCARNTVLDDPGGAGVENDGLVDVLQRQGLRGAVIVGSALMHHSFTKAAGILGIGARNLIRVPTDGDHRVDLDAVRGVIRECAADRRRIIAIVGVAGSTDSGSIDPLPELAMLAQEADAPFHIDAAWGGGLLFSERHRAKLAGIEQADSVTLDGHKQLYLPTGVGILLLRDPSTARVIEQQAPYMLRPGSADLGRRALEGSRPGTALFLDAALHILGRTGYGMLVDEAVRRTLRAADMVRERNDFELLVEPASTILLYRFIPRRLRRKAREGALGESENLAVNRSNELVYQAQRRAGTSLVSRTLISDSRRPSNTPLVALRAILANPLTSDEIVEAILDEQATIGAALENGDGAKWPRVDARSDR